MEAVNVAVVGVTGAVGEVMLEILESRNFPVDTLFPLASSRSAGKSAQFRGSVTPFRTLANSISRKRRSRSSRRVVISAQSSRQSRRRQDVL